MVPPATTGRTESKYVPSCARSAARIQFIGSRGSHRSVVSFNKYPGGPRITISARVSRSHDSNGANSSPHWVCTPPRCAPYLFYLNHGLLTSDAAYPPPSAPPNVPARSLGDVRDRGLAAWFTMSVVNTSVLHRVLESQLERTDDWHPVHLRGRMVPPPPTVYGEDPRR